MVTVKSIETIQVQLPTRRVHKWTGLTETIGRYVLVKMTGSDGTVGWGEAPALKDWGGEFGRYFGESASIVDLVVKQYLAPAAAGTEIGNAADLHRRMDAAIKGFPYAKAAVDFAFYDLTGRSLGLSVSTLLGGRLKDAVPITHSIGLLDEAEAVDEVKKVVHAGIKTIKIKVGVNARRDISIVHAIRQAVGPDVDLCIDANEGYQSPGEAIQVVRKLRDCHLKYVEQPVMGMDRIAMVAKAIDEPVMADESAWNAHDALQIIEKQAAQIISIYTTKAGGLYKAMAVSAVCEAAGILCNVNGSIETGVGNLANVHLAACAPAVKLSNVIPVSIPAQFQKGHIAGIYYTDDLLQQPMQFENGCVIVPQGPGMGLDVDLQKIEKYRVN